MLCAVGRSNCRPTNSPKINAVTTLVGAYAGPASVTVEFEVDLPASKIDAGLLETRMRHGSCEKHNANIKKGLSYIYIFRAADGDDIARIAVSSCP
jgi:hypothetical protein